MTRLLRIILMTVSHLWRRQAAVSCLRWLVRWRASVAAAEFSNHVMPTPAFAMAGIYGCSLSLSSFLS